MPVELSVTLIACCLSWLLERCPFMEEAKGLTNLIGFVALCCWLVYRWGLGG
jgi:hypothetical protein